MQLKSKVGSLIKLLFYILYYINGVLKENEKLTPLVLFISTIDSNESKKNYGLENGAKSQPKFSLLFILKSNLVE